jgi:hypothetical protein
MFIHYILHNINIDGNMMNSWRTFIYLMSVKRVRGWVLSMAESNGDGCFF